MSFQVQSNDVKCFQAVEKTNSLFSTTLKNYFHLSNYPGAIELERIRYYISSHENKKV